jgi:16S rRNA (cytosine967-C5)-methyltransferase
MRYQSYLNTALQLISDYTAQEPFAHYCKKYFKEHKKHGSTDRKQIIHLCYCYFRLGNTAKQLPAEERMLLALYLCSTTANPLLQALKPAWNESVLLPLREKYAAIHVFSFNTPCSDGMDREAFAAAHFVQPDLFLRIRPGKEMLVKTQLNRHAISFKQIGTSCIALPNATKIETVVQLDTDAVVQDYSSQQIERFLRLVKVPVNKKMLVWDCCAASGGKSIMAKDTLEQVELTVSDVRASILLNLKKRFAAAGISGYKAFIADLTRSTFNVQLPLFHLIMADVPCSGSGTWGRIPEQLSFFKEETLMHYNNLQKKIVATVIPRLLTGGYLLYSTCSVFKSENEAVVEFITGNFPVSLVHMELIKGYHKKADTMFAALLKKQE